MKETMKDTLLLLKAYCKAERILMNFQMRSLMRKAIFIHLTIAVGFISYVLLNIAGYLALIVYWERIYAILILSGINFMVTGLLMTRIFAVPKQGKKEILALELRQLTCEKLQKHSENMSENINNFEAIFCGIMPLLKNVSAIGSVLGIFFTLLKPLFRKKNPKA